MKPLQHRPDIDGLRAIAIISVVGFHVGLTGFDGGYAGVDIFFVISGYLITTLLLNEQHQTGAIDLPAFYARRARRLLPAFFLVISTTIMLGVWFLVPADGEQKRFAVSVIAAALYFSNWHFSWAGSGYFDAPSSLYPLLHTWSLAVEEQFYLTWPAMVVASAWAARRLRAPPTRVASGLLALVLIGSFAYGLWAEAVGGQTRTIAFFALPARAWEIGVGACLAIMLARAGPQSERSGTVFAAVGTLAIVISIVAFDDGEGFPSAAALLPTVGAAAIILGGHIAPKNIVARSLSSRPMVAIGLVSYSWYLWHWPLLAIVRSDALGVKNLWRDAAVALIALALAGLSYRFVEQPFRRRRIGRDWSSVKTLGAGAVASIALVVAAEALARNADFKLSRLAVAQADIGWSGHRCYRDSGAPYGGLIPKAKCMEMLNPDQKVLVVWGDSHADHLVGMLETADTAKQFAILSRPQGLCPPLIGVIPRKGDRPFEECATFNRQVLAEVTDLHEQGRLYAVVLSAHWALYTDKPKLAGGIGVPLWKDGQWFRDGNALDALTDGLRAMLRALVAKGIKVFVVAPIAEQRFRSPECLARRTIGECSVSISVAENHRRVSLGAVKEAVKGFEGVYMWDPLPPLCRGGVCLAERDNTVIYRDGDHLTYAGSRWLGAYLARSVEWTAFVKQQDRLNEH